MLTSDPRQQFEELKEQLLAQVNQTFPVRDRAERYEVRVSDLSVDDKLGVDDIRGQFDARMSGRSWAVPVNGTIEVVDVVSGKTLVRKPNSVIAKIPKLTRHYSYIIGGQEKFISNQWRLRPGAYVKATNKPGEFEAQFQLAKGRSFDVQVDETGYLFMRLGGRKIPAYSVLHALEVSDEAMKKAWGDKSFDATKKKSKVDKDLRSLYSAWRNEPMPDASDPIIETRAIFEGTRLDKEIAKANLKVDTDRVNGALFFGATKKLLDVAANREKPDPIDSIRYKELWTAKDQFIERIAQSTPEIHRRVQQALGKPTISRKLEAGDGQVMRDVFMPDLIQRPLYHVFATSLASNGKQTNPLAMLSDRSMVTITGPGGIQNRHVLSSSKSHTALDPSHLGFLDPVFTPESNAGVNTHMTMGLIVKDKKPMIRLYNTSTQKIEEVDAAQAAVSRIALPDQVKWSGGKPVPLGNVVRVSDEHGVIRDDLPWSSVKYVVPSSAQIFAAETNLVPFMQNDSAGRSTMSARHMAQAISVTGREPPLVQVEAGSKKSFEELIGGGFLSHRSPVDGVVESVAPDGITVRGADGKKHLVHLYDHYPTNHDKGMLQSKPLVAKGDRVTSGQLLADNNFTKNGTLALGTNVRVAYLANGSNHEDGIVISESAQKKLSSEHLYKPSMLVTDDHVVDKRAFLNAKNGVFPVNKLSNIDDNGIIRPGTKIEPGDPLILALREDTRMIATGPRAAAKIGKRLRSKYDNAALTWDSDYPGIVVRSGRSGNHITVHVKTLEPVQVGSKISTRHSAKGIVTEIMPDKDMPHDAKGKHVEMLINPVSVPGRINAGQILETVAAKIAYKTGKPYLVKNFQGGVDYLKKVKAELASHGLSETESLFDPKTGRKLGDITVGPHYIFQLEHQIDKKTHVRSGGPAFPVLGMPKLPYEPNTMIPRGGGHQGAQSLGSLGIYAALAAGMKDNLREMQTLKSDQPQATAVWDALTNGHNLPAPQIPFVFKKFEAMLAGMGVDLQKDGTKLRLIPMTDKEILERSRGEIRNPTKTVHGKNDKPVAGGLFDSDITGGAEGGGHWGHIRLAEPMPNPVYAKAIAHTLGIREDDIPLIIEGKKKLPGGQYGGRGFREVLSKINLDKEIETTRAALDNTALKGSPLEKTHFKYRALKALKDAGKNPAEAWTIQNVPVLPPVFRPQTTMLDGTVKNHPLNALYRRLGVTNDSLIRGAKIPYNTTLDTQAGLYQELQNLFGTTPKGKKALDLDVRGTKEDRDKKLPGIIHMIAGDVPKDGFFQDKMIEKKQDYTARATIVVDPNLSMDELGVPKKIAIEMFRPMVVNRLMRYGFDGERAQKMVSQKAPQALRALEQEVALRPILMKRDPVLHQYGLVAQRIKLTDDPAIKVSPLILPPIGGDIDGDTVALMTPLTHQAVEEAKLILPSQRTLSDSSGEVIFSPTNEAALALYRTTLPRGRNNKIFKDKAAVEAAFRNNTVNLNDVINVTGVGETTLGRLRIAEVVPASYRPKILTDLKSMFDRKAQSSLLKEVAKNDSKNFSTVVDGLSRLGFQLAYDSGHTVTLNDLEPLRKLRDDVIHKTMKEVGKLKGPGAEDAATKLWMNSTNDMYDSYMKHFEKNPTNISDMAVSGIKAKREQFQGLIMAPMLVEDSYGKPYKTPITKSFAEGLDIGGYFMQAAGARRGIIQKTDSVRQPGYMSKLLVQANMDTAVSSLDCGTSQGVSMPIKNRDVIDRHLAVPVSIDGHNYAAGTIVTPDMLAHAEKARMGQLVVRSPLKCRAAHGVCSKCMGVHPSGHNYSIGENVGIIAAQALGERAAQLMLKQTHGGGIVSTTGGSGADAFGDVQRVFSAAKRSIVDPIVSPSEGVVSKVEATRHGSWQIKLEGNNKALNSRQKPLAHIKPGYSVQRGEILSEGDPNIHDILHTKGLDAVQAYMVDRVGNIYGKEGVLRRHVELAVRSATGTVRIIDPGDHTGYIRGDYVTKNVADELNRTVLKGKKPIRYETELLAASMIPTYREPDFMARLQSERLGENLLRGIQHGHSTDPHGRHPIPALAVGVAVGRGHHDTPR